MTGSLRAGAGGAPAVRYISRAGGRRPAVSGALDLAGRGPSRLGLGLDNTGDRGSFWSRMSRNIAYIVPDQLVRLLADSQVGACDEINALLADKLGEGWRLAGISITRARSITRHYRVTVQLWRGEVANMDITHEDWTIPQCRLTVALMGADY